MMKILVLTSVFPNTAQPNLGVFVRERMFKVAKHCELKVIAPVPWFPFINYVKKDYRPLVEYYEESEGIEIYHPKFFNFPKIFKFLDGLFFFLSTVKTVHNVKKRFNFDVIDTHFAYPCGFGAILMGMLFSRPVTITVRGNERVYLQEPIIKNLVAFSLQRSAKVFAVCNELKELVVHRCGPNIDVTVIGNGVDIAKFSMVERTTARMQLNLPLDKKIVLSAGGLIKWKGFHKIIRSMPVLLDSFPDLLLVIVGGAPTNDNYEPELKKLVEELGLQNHVLLAGASPHSEMNKWMSAADIFCLATQGEGWANVFLEAMSCGIPVVTTRVGGNPEVVANGDVGILFDLDNEQQMISSIIQALSKKWDRNKIITYAHDNTWESRVQLLLKEFSAIKNEKVI